MRRFQEKTASVKKGEQSPLYHSGNNVPNQKLEEGRPPGMDVAARLTELRTANLPVAELTQFLYHTSEQKR